MFLASGDVLWPVAGVCLLVVEEAADAELLGGGPVPAGPVAGARGLVAEDAVQPVAVLRALGRVWGQDGFRQSENNCAMLSVLWADRDNYLDRYQIPPNAPLPLHGSVCSVFDICGRK